MNIDFLTVRGSFLNCRRCREQNFIMSRQVMELWEDEYRKVPFKCSGCGHRQEQPIEKTQGQRKTEFRRMTISG